jgi:L-lactate dehydrogenase complex protein LldG
MRPKTRKRTVPLDTSNAKEEVLARIRSAIGDGAFRASSLDAVSATDIESAWQAIPRDYRRTASLDHEGIIHLIDDRLRDYDAHVVRVSPSQVAETVAHLLAERGFTRMLVAEGTDASWLPGAPVQFTVDTGMAPAAMGEFDGVLTGATVAIAETGTLILQNAPGQGRRALTLVPDYHLCILEEHRIVETVPEAMDRIAPTAAEPTTFFSGPSATADIEMTRIKGVHGPRFLDIILVRSA